MTIAPDPCETRDYARCIRASKKVRWDIDTDVLRGRSLSCSQKFLPDGLSFVGEMDWLDAAERRLMSQIQGRTYANMFGLVERYIGAKILEIGADYALGDQVALEALVRFSDEEIKHQELFRRLEAMAAQAMAPGYVFGPDPNGVAQAVLSKSTWAVLALTCHIELFTQAHYKQSLEADANVSEVYRDVFMFHWREECQHAVLDELEWRREDARLSDDERDAAVDDLIALVGAVDNGAQSLPVAVHRLGRAAPALLGRPGGARQRVAAGANWRGSRTAAHVGLKRQPVSRR
jgi:hypothetical protein